MLKSIVRKCYRIKESADFSLHALEHLFDFSALLPRNAFTPLHLWFFPGSTRQRQTFLSSLLQNVSDITLPEKDLDYLAMLTTKAGTFAWYVYQRGGHAFICLYDYLRKK